jgi:hypothetical protein
MEVLSQQLVLLLLLLLLLRGPAATVLSRLTLLSNGVCQ